MIKERILEACYARNEDTYDSLFQIFQALDKDQSGGIDPLEFKRGMDAFGVKLTEEEVSQVVKYFDLNKDGKISFSEFLSALERK